MPLKVTIELIPHGNEFYKRTLAIVDIVNNGTGTSKIGNYEVRAVGECRGGAFDEFYRGTVKNIPRGDYIDTAVKCMKRLITKKEKKT